MTLQLIVLSALLSWCSPNRPGDLCHDIKVTCTPVEESDTKIAVTTHNVSQRRIEVRVKVTLYLSAVPSEGATSGLSSLVSSFDPTTGVSEGLFETKPAVIKLPVGASHSAVLDLTRLLWSLSSADVVAPTTLWSLDAWGQYKAGVTMRRYPSERFDYRPIGCDSVLVRLPRG